MLRAVCEGKDERMEEVLLSGTCAAFYVLISDALTYVILMHP